VSHSRPPKKKTNERPKGGLPTPAAGTQNKLELGGYPVTKQLDCSIGSNQTPRHSDRTDNCTLVSVGHKTDGPTGVVGARPSSTPPPVDSRNPSLLTIPQVLSSPPPFFLGAKGCLLLLPPPSEQPVRPFTVGGRSISTGSAPRDDTPGGGRGLIIINSRPGERPNGQQRPPPGRSAAETLVWSGGATKVRTGGGG
jgi:hypothetical protein